MYTKPRHRGHCSKLNKTMKKGMSSGRRKKKPDLHKKKNGSKNTGTLNTNQELTTKIKQTYNNIKIWNQVQENPERFFSVVQKKRRKKLVEVLDLHQKNSI